MARGIDSKKDRGSAGKWDEMLPVLGRAFGVLGLSWVGNLALPSGFSAALQPADAAGARAQGFALG